ncbi:MAG: glycosyltransferase family 2 protein [Prevotella sp.]|nr:glycosyltransferase family 2 protein [Prevotella sp.]MBQ2949981.1 glycosyltransferase family 2 protein [Prevotella sp.]
MAWYDKYLSIYDKPFSEVPANVVEETRNRLAKMQSDKPLISIVVIAYNEETHLQACLWALSEIKCKYPLEIIGVNNDSKDRTAEIFEASGIPYYTEYQHSCGYARRCGLQHAKGKYYFDVDADTLYPPHYYDILMEQLLKPDVSCVSSLWSYFPDKNHTKFGLAVFELCRDLFLWVQHFKRPELSVRGLVFAYNIDYARNEEYRVDIIRGEDGSMALALKKYGKIAFVYNRKARAITGYGTLNDESLWDSFVKRIKIQGKGIMRIFHKTEHYEDSEDNLVK